MIDIKNYENITKIEKDDEGYYTSDKIIDSKFISNYLGVCPATTSRIIREANKLAKKDGVELFLKGKTTLNYFYKIIGIKTRVV